MKSGSPTHPTVWLLNQLGFPNPLAFSSQARTLSLLLVTNIRREWYWYCLMWNVIELQRLACSTGATSAKPQGVESCQNWNVTIAIFMKITHSWGHLQFSQQSVNENIYIFLFMVNICPVVHTITFVNTGMIQCVHPKRTQASCNLCKWKSHNCNGSWDTLHPCWCLQSVFL